MESMNAPLSSLPPFPLNPAVGQVWGNWVWNGVVWAWRGNGPLVSITVFTASGSYTPSPNATFVTVECLGGGGGGGGAMALLTSSTASSMIFGGGGGGAGGYSRSVLDVAALSPPVPITIGVGGVGGIGGGGSMSHGGAGTQTSFGTLVTANGGGGGYTNNTSIPAYVFGRGGTGAPFGDGKVQMMGGFGQRGQTVYWNGSIGGEGVSGGSGGGNAYAPLGAQAFVSPTGTPVGINGPGGVFSQGGGGGASALSTTFGSGGVGGGGVVILTE